MSETKFNGNVIQTLTECGEISAGTRPVFINTTNQMSETDIYCNCIHESCPVRLDIAQSLYKSSTMTGMSMWSIERTWLGHSSWDIPCSSSRFCVAWDRRLKQWSCRPIHTQPHKAVKTRQVHAKSGRLTHAWITCSVSCKHGLSTAARIHVYTDSAKTSTPMKMTLHISQLRQPWITSFNYHHWQKSECLFTIIFDLFDGISTNT
jgi:hypothetical protein